MSHLVSNGTIYARIDRPAGIMTFSEPEACEKQVTNYKGKLFYKMKFVAIFILIFLK